MAKFDTGIQSRLALNPDDEEAASLEEIEGEDDEGCESYTGEEDDDGFMFVDDDIFTFKFCCPFNFLMHGDFSCLESIYCCITSYVLMSCAIVLQFPWVFVIKCDKHAKFYMTAFTDTLKWTHYTFSCLFTGEQSLHPGSRAPLCLNVLGALDNHDFGK